MNKSGNNNRSVRNTKKKLLTGLLSLMREKPISSITVRELTELVDVNRGTFYFHYADIYDLIRQVEEDFLLEFNEIIDNMMSNIPIKSYPPKILVNIFSFCAENRDLCEVLLGPNGDAAFVDQIKNIVDEKCSATWKSIGAHMSLEEYEYFNTFIINGFIGILEKWLKTGCKQTPEQMAIFEAKINHHAANSSMGFAERNG